MGTKALFGLTVVPAAIVIGILLATISRRLRDFCFVLLVFLSAVIERVDVNFVSREWYRGSSRGFEVSIPGILALCLLVGCILAPRRQGLPEPALSGRQRGGAAGRDDPEAAAAETGAPGPRLYWPGSFGFLLLFFIYACFNVAMAEPKLFGLFELFKMVWGLVVFLAAALYVRGERELRLLILALASAVCFEGLAALAQRYWWHVHRVYGSLDDSNSLSMFLCTTAPVLLAAFTSRIPRLLKALCALAIALAVVAEVMTISRAGVITMGVVLFGTALATMSFRLTGKTLAVALVSILVIGGVVAKSWKSLTGRFAESSLKQEYGRGPSMGRGYYLRIAALIAEDTWLGVGLNNWSYWVSNKYGPKLGYHFTPYKDTDREPSYKIADGANLDDPQAAPAHNLGALTLGELGLGGLGLFALLWLRWFQMGASFLWPRLPLPARRLAVGIFFGCAGIFLQSLTEWVFRQLPIYYTFHLLLGTLASLYYLKKRQKRRTRLAQREAAVALDQPIPAQVFT